MNSAAPPLDFSVLATLDGFTTAEAKQMLGFAGDLDQLAQLLRQNCFDHLPRRRLFIAATELMWVKRHAVDELAAKLAASDGLNWHEQCGYERSAQDANAPEECDSATCVAANYEDHDASVARANYRKWAATAIAHLATPQRNGAEQRDHSTDSVLPHEWREWLQDQRRRIDEDWAADRQEGENSPKPRNIPDEILTSFPSQGDSAGLAEAVKVLAEMIGPCGRDAIRVNAEAKAIFDVAVRAIAASTPAPKPALGLVEAAAIHVAKALYGDNYDPFAQPEALEWCTEIAKAALSATPAPIDGPRIPDGYVLVPRETTDAAAALEWLSERDNLEVTNASSGKWQVRRQSARCLRGEGDTVLDAIKSAMLTAAEEGE